MMLRMSVCLSVPSWDCSPDVTCGRFAAECRACTASGATALVTARYSAANASSVTLTANVGIRKLKSDLFLWAIITAFSKGGCKLVT